MAEETTTTETETHLYRVMLDHALGLVEQCGWSCYSTTAHRHDEWTPYDRALPGSYRRIANGAVTVQIVNTYAAVREQVLAFAPAASVQQRSATVTLSYLANPGLARELPFRVNVVCELEERA